MSVPGPWTTRSLQTGIEGSINTYFAELAKQNSRDPGSKAQGGDLGFFGRGQMVPQFEEAAFKLKSGEVSAPIRSQFGWHIIKVEGRRDEDVTTETLRSRAGEYLHNHKYQEELDAWLQQIRDEAFVDIK